MLEKQHENFEVAMRKWEMLAATKVKMSGSEKQNKPKKKNKNTYDISSIKRVATKFLEFSLYIVVVQNNGKEMYKKKCAARAKLLFC